MWARTYGCLLDEILKAEMLANEAQTNRFQRLLEQVGGDLERGLTSAKPVNRE
jgi:hypothetical protein